jgi:hypothetical protein
MQNHNNSNSTILLPSIVLAAFFGAIAIAILLTFHIFSFICVKGWVVATAQGQQPVQAVAYPEDAIVAIFEEEAAPIVSGISEQRVEAAEEIVTSDVPVAEPEVPQDDETLVQVDQALLLLKGVNRNGWHAMLGVIGEQQQCSIPPNFKQMSKNNSRANALLRLKVSTAVLQKAREIALQRQKATV